MKEEPDFFIKQEDEELPYARKFVKRTSRCQPCSVKSNRITSLQSELNELRSKTNKLESDNTILRSAHEKVCLEYEKLRSTNDDLMTSLTKQKNQPATVDSYGENEFEVEAIIGHEKRGNRWFFHVRWKGFTEEDCTWERRANLKHNEVFLKYLKAHKMK